MNPSATPRRPARRSFVLLEVLVSLAILSIALSMALRSFAVSVKAARLSRNVTIAAMLARTLIEQWEIVAPESGSVSGSFAPGYPEFFFAAQYGREPIKYEETPNRKVIHHLVGLRRVSLDVYYIPQQRENAPRKRLLHVETALTSAEKFNPPGRMYNEIGFDD